MGEPESAGQSTQGVPIGSLQHAKNLLKLLYQKEGFAFERLGEVVTREFGTDIGETKLSSLFCLLDEVIIIYHNLKMAMVCSIATGNGRAPFDYRFANSALNSLCAIRLLLGKGLDLEARVQLRTLREIMIAWLFFDKFPEKRDDFSRPQTLEEANHFWYSNLRKAETTLERIAEDGSFHPHMGEKLISIERVLNTAAHPSWVGMDHSARANWHNPSNFVTYQPISNASLFSLSAALTFAAFGYGPIKPIAFSVPAGMANLFPTHTHCTDINEVLDRLQKMPALIFLFACHFAQTLTEDASGTSASS